MSHTKYGSLGEVPDIETLRDQRFEKAISDRNMGYTIPQSAIDSYSQLLHPETPEQDILRTKFATSYCLLLAQYYMEECVPQDESRAFYWYLHAAEKESVKARFLVATKLARNSERTDKLCAIRLFDEVSNDFSHRHEDMELFRKASTEKLILLSQIDPVGALPELKKELIKRSISDDISDESDRVINALREAYILMGTHTTVIMKHIEPSQSKDTKETIKMYQSLLAPTPLAGCNDLLSSTRLLNFEFPWMHKVTDHITRQIRSFVRMGIPAVKIAPLLLVGAPGIGKTRYLLRVSELLGVPRLCYPVGGHSDNRDFAGTSRGWAGGHSCLPLKLMAQEMIANPLIILDEIDKANQNDDSARNGKITDTLHLMLERVTAEQFYDEFLCGVADLSWVNWVATANDISRLPQSLLSRFHVVHVKPPAIDDYPAIVHGILHDIADRYRVTTNALPNLTEAEWCWLESYFGNIRRLRKAVELLIAYMLENEEGRAIH
jgi:hypothetical protein